MTEHELRKVPFHLVMHLSLAKEHTCSYVSEDGKLGFCDHTPIIEECDGLKKFGKPYRHWRIEDRVYQSKKRLLGSVTKFSSVK